MNISKKLDYLDYFRGLIHAGQYISDFSEKNEANNLAPFTCNGI
jgi:hypothetical protein